MRRGEMHGAVEYFSKKRGDRRGKKKISEEREREEEELKDKDRDGEGE